ncbi:MAG: hypothetical protein M0C28_40765 [Candidatus Moduliflexus flocculans]|nr:hypothetical protein [Candidatus Moduliflexus flocculans]
MTAETMTGTGQLPKFEEDLFKTAGETPLYLIPTAEVPVTNMHRDEIFEAERAAHLLLRLDALLPRRGRRGTGSDTRGLIRQHQFHKVELVKFATAEESYAELREDGATTPCEVLQRLGLHLPRGRCSAPATWASRSAKTYDLEVWLPGQDALPRDLARARNCEDFQARRSQHALPRPPDGKPRLRPHAQRLAAWRWAGPWWPSWSSTSRPTGSVLVPEALRPYMGGLERITARQFPRGVEAVSQAAGSSSSTVAPTSTSSTEAVAAVGARHLADDARGPWQAALRSRGRRDRRARRPPRAARAGCPAPRPAPWRAPARHGRPGAPSRRTTAPPWRLACDPVGDQLGERLGEQPPRRRASAATGAPPSRSFRPRCTRPQAGPRC